MSDEQARCRPATSPSRRGVRWAGEASLDSREADDLGALVLGSLATARIANARWSSA